MMRKGAPSQLISELENKIADLKGVESSVAVEASEDAGSYKIRFYQMSGPDKGNLDHEEFFDTKAEALKKYREVFDKKLYSLNPTVYEKSNDGWRRLMGDDLVESSAEVIDDGEDVIEATDSFEDENSEDETSEDDAVEEFDETSEDDHESYLNDLYADVEDKLNDLLEEVSWSSDVENIYMDVSFQDGHVFTFTIPREDLIYDMENMDTDVNYICDAVREEENVAPEVSSEDAENPDWYDEENYYDEDGNPPVYL